MKQASVLTIGNFDGIHLGHRKLLKRMIQIAQAENLSSVVLSYTDHPAFTLSSSAGPKMLCPATLKKRELHQLGIDKVELLSFTSDFAHTSAIDFLREYLMPVWQPRVIIMGYDSHFGYDRQGDYQFLRSHAAEFAYRVEYIEPLLHKGRPISSSLIRELLTAGDIQTANQLLGKPYRMLGDICHGTSQGRDFGFPTANLVLTNPHQLVPKCGIYLSKAFIDGQQFFGLTNIGSSPTVKHTGIVEIETYLIDFNQDVYGCPMELELHKFIREEKMFNSVEELIAAMQGDLKQAVAMLKGSESA